MTLKPLEGKILEFRLRDGSVPPRRDIDNLIPGEGYVILTHRRVLRAAAEIFQCSQDSFFSRRRFPEEVNRRTAVVLALRKLGLSLPEIGRILKKHHTTILSLERRGLGDPRLIAVATVIVERAMTP